MIQRGIVTHPEPHSAEMIGAWPEQRQPVGTSLTSEAAQPKPRASWMEAFGSCSRWAPVRLVLFAASRQLSYGQAKGSFLQTQNVPGPPHP